MVMKDTEFLNIDGPSGQLQTAISYPAHSPIGIAIICHPHPLYEGTMNNKVVTTVAKSLLLSQLITIRFNFRGVEQSEGEYGNISGESADLEAVIEWVTQNHQLPLTLAGFSFGSYISAKAATQHTIAQLISIAPPVSHMPFNDLKHINAPWLVIQGSKDEVIDSATVIAWAKNPPAPLQFVLLPEIGHYFHGQLIQLQHIITESCQHNLQQAYENYFQGSP